MLPVASDLGLTETYGTTSVSSIKIVDGKLVIEDPTVTEETRCLQIQKESLITIHRTTIQDDIDASSEGLPKNQGIDLNSKKDLFDPCVGNLVEMAIHDGIQYAAFSAGTHNSILLVGEIEENDKLKFLKHKALNMKKEIKRIKIVKVNDIRIILVTTSEDLHLLRYEGRKVSLLFNFKVEENWANLAHADLIYDDEDGVLKLACIDQIGKFCVWKAEHNLTTNVISSFKIIDLKFESIYDPLDMSHFKKLVWINGNRLILFTRIQLHEYNLTTEKLQCRISAGIWSKLLDLVSDVSGEYYYMLTSKELIVIDVKSGKFKRKFAWKHYFNDLDTSMYLTTSIIDKEEVCVVTSKQIPAGFVFRFNQGDYKVINTPTIFLPSTNEPIQSMVLENIGGKLLMLQKLESGVSTCFVEFKEGITATNIEEKKKLFKKDQIEVDTRDMEEIMKLETYNKYANLEMPSSTEITAQIYQQLEAFMKSNTTQITLFQITANLHIPRRVENVSKIVEYMVRNNKDKYFDIFINKESWMTDNRISQRIEASKESLKDHSDFLKQWIPGLDMVVFYLFLSSIEIWKNEQTMDIEEVEDLLEEAEEDLDDNIKEILNSYDDAFDVVGIYDSDKESDDDAGNDTFSNVWSIPTVAVSQTQTQTQTQTQKKARSKSNLRHNITNTSNIKPKIESMSGYTSSRSTNVVSQRQSMEPSSQIRESQTPSSQPERSQTFSQRFSQAGASQSQKPKKKKRKGGF